MPVVPLGTDVNPFDRVQVDFKVAGQSRVSWRLSRHFFGVEPYSYQLQVGWTGSGSADDWEDVGSPEVNVAALTDATPQKLGKLSQIHYRVVLTDADDNVWESAPAHSEGSLGPREWFLARELIYREKLLAKKMTGVDGYLVKARRHGAPCTDCIDPFTQECVDSKCPTCRGTGFEQGFYAPIAESYSRIEPGPIRDMRGGERATVGDQFVSGRFVGTLQIHSYDAWIDRYSDERYYVHTVKPVAYMRNVPLAYEVELRLASVDDILYSIVLP